MMNFNFTKNTNGTPRITFDITAPTLHDFRITLNIGKADEHYYEWQDFANPVIRQTLTFNFPLAHHNFASDNAYHLRIHVTATIGYDFVLHSLIRTVIGPKTKLINF
ncbi:hypothetical protein, partial [Klebsiella pneumoniae]|uniref:hypothetical protein n=1 Tax=Klebsiella pneumoniae TaxID=573 RepID=UPI0039C0076D